MPAETAPLNAAPHEADTPPAAFAEAQALVTLQMGLGRVQRLTRHPPDPVEPNKTPPQETVATHSGMLAVLVLRYADREPVALDPARLAALALLHDYPEALTATRAPDGSLHDVPTLRPLSREDREAKEASEATATDTIRASSAWAADLIAEAAANETPEARYVHVWDKLLPLLAHSIGTCTVLIEQRVSLETLARLRRERGAAARRLAPEFTWVHAFAGYATAQVLAVYAAALRDRAWVEGPALVTGTMPTPAEDAGLWLLAALGADRGDGTLPWAEVQVAAFEPGTATWLPRFHPWWAPDSVQPLRGVLQIVAAGLAAFSPDRSVLTLSPALIALCQSALLLSDLPAPPAPAEEQIP